MRKWLQNMSPDREGLLAKRWLRPIAHRLAHPQIWHMNRRNVARGVALGLFVGFILPIGQIIVAALLASSTRSNLLVAAMATLITNPFTFPLIYLAAFRVGSVLINSDSAEENLVSSMNEQTGSMFDMLTSASLPTMFGLIFFAIAASSIGYSAVHVGWRLSLWMQWRRRGKGAS